MAAEHVYIGIFGPVSAGKFTFLNSILSNTMSSMNRKKTTLLPQCWRIPSDHPLDPHTHALIGVVVAMVVDRLMM